MNPVFVFLKPSDFLEHDVFRPLSHIWPNWDPFIDSNTGRYVVEEGSCVGLFNELIDELATTEPPVRYHDSEDRLAEYVRDHTDWKVQKRGSVWVDKDGAQLSKKSYLSLLERGGFKFDRESDLVVAAAGRIKAAIRYGQLHYDDMELSHQVILAGVLTNILYHRS